MKAHHFPRLKEIKDADKFIGVQEQRTFSTAPVSDFLFDTETAAIKEIKRIFRTGNRVTIIPTKAK